MTHGAKRTMLAIAGMKDNDCRERVAEALAAVAGVKDVSVSLIRAVAVVIYGPPCEFEALVRAVECVGCGVSRSADATRNR